MQEAWQELVEQVREGGRAGEALGLEEPLEQLSREEFWERLVVKGVGDTPLSFLPPDLGELAELLAGPPPQEELVVLPPCLCLDSVLQPEFVLPPAELFAEYSQEERGTERSVRAKRKRESSPDSVETSVTIDDDVIDLTQGT